LHENLFSTKHDIAPPPKSGVDFGGGRVGVPYTNTPRPKSLWHWQALLREALSACKRNTTHPEMIFEVSFFLQPCFGRWPTQGNADFFAFLSVDTCTWPRSECRCQRSHLP